MVETIVWSWRDGSDAAVVHATGFPTQAEAEAWLAEGWEELFDAVDLFDAGVVAVSLYEGDRLVYGPMPLEPAT